VSDPREAGSAQCTLFPLPPVAPAERELPADPEAGARLRRANRAQRVWGPIDCDDSLPPDHPARDIWAVLEKLDLRAFYAQVEARDSEPGVAAIDPRILLALWIYATSDGVASGREIADLTRRHDAYRWICGGVTVAYRCLTDFRAQSGKRFAELVTQVLALMMKHELLDLHRVAQDGTRVRASAGASSFRRGQTLAQLVTEARAHLDQITREADAKVSACRAAAQRRGARDRLQRLEAALAELPEIEATKRRSGAKDTTPRASTTDAEARVMKMGDGGFRPAFNVQFATTTDAARAIVGVSVGNRGSDMGQATPMIQQIEARTGVRPDEFLVDGGYAKHDAIDEAAALGTTFFAPLPKPRSGDQTDPTLPKEGDSPAVAEWRARMGTVEAKEIYKQRAATAETVNADGKVNRGLDHFSVRGIDSVTGVACLFALTYDILRYLSIT